MRVRRLYFERMCFLKRRRWLGALYVACVMFEGKVRINIWTIAALLSKQCCEILHTRSEPRIMLPGL